MKIKYNIAISRSTIANLVGAMLFFTAFTQIGLGGGSIYLIYFLPVICIFAVLILVLEKLQKPTTSYPLIFMCALIIIAHISIFSLQYIISFVALTVALIASLSSSLWHRVPTYAYIAMILNTIIYFVEIILQFIGVNFDASIFNYVDSGRSEIITTWGFERYSAHHTEPGSFAINIGGLAVLSLMGTRAPNIFHWFAVLAMATTLSITAAIVTFIVITSIFVAREIRNKTIILSIVGLAIIIYFCFNIMPTLGLNVVEFLSYRLIDRGGADGSIGVKSQLINELINRDWLSSMLGNRNTPCDICMYSKSLGFAFNIIYEGGLLGFIAIFSLFTVAIHRLGLRGLMLVLMLSFMRVEFYYPQTIIIILAVFALPRTVATRSNFVPANQAAPVPARATRFTK